jgi:hypothetical protein
MTFEHVVISRSSSRRPLPTEVFARGTYTPKEIQVYCRQSSKLVSSIEQILKVAAFCGEGRAVIQPNSFHDTEQVLIVTGFPGSEGCSLSGLSSAHSTSPRSISVTYRMHHTRLFSEQAEIRHTNLVSRRTE